MIQIPADIHSAYTSFIEQRGVKAGYHTKENLINQIVSSDYGQRGLNLSLTWHVTSLPQTNEKKKRLNSTPFVHASPFVQFLAIDEYNRLIRNFSQKAQNILELRNLIIIMLLGILGLRTSTLIAINIEDVDLTSGLIWIREKGRLQRNLVLPHTLCKTIHKNLQLLRHKKGPLLISKHKKRVSARTL